MAAWRGIVAEGWGSRPLRVYDQVIPSPPPISRAKKAPTDASKLPFNMSVTPLQAYQNSGSGKPRYGPPDAPLDSCPLVFARVRYHLRRPGSPYLFFPFCVERLLA